MRAAISVAVMLAASACAPAAESQNRDANLQAAEVAASNLIAGAPADAKSLSSGNEAAGSPAAADTVETAPPAREVANAPSFDTVSYCEEVSATVGGSYVIEKTCRDAEAEAQREIASMSYPDRVSRYCTDVANAVGSGGSYTIFKTCVESELSARSEL